MLRRVQCTDRILSLAGAVVVGLAVASCGGGFEGDSVTGASVLPEASTPPQGSGPVTFTAQGHREGGRHGGDHNNGDRDRNNGDRDHRNGDRDHRNGDRDRNNGDRDHRNGDRDRKDGDRDHRNGDRDRKDGDRDRKGADHDRGDADGDCKRGDDGDGSQGHDTVLICHEGQEKSVGERWVEHWLRLGATLGECPAAVSCPCFSVDDILAAASQCSTTVTPTCSIGNPYYLFLGCEAGGSVPPSVLGVYLSQVSDGGYCERNDVFGSFSQTGLTPAEYQACIDEINASGYCS
jgi:hypothetical protein